MARRDVREHARAAVTMRLVTSSVHTLRKFLSPMSLEVYEVEIRARVGRAGCLSAGWPRTLRQRACAEDFVTRTNSK